jgi:hypothetical protein
VDAMDEKDGMDRAGRQLASVPVAAVNPLCGGCRRATLLIGTGAPKGPLSILIGSAGG